MRLAQNGRTEPDMDKQITHKSHIVTTAIQDYLIFNLESKDRSGAFLAYPGDPPVSCLNLPNRSNSISSGIEKHELCQELAPTG